MNNNDILIRFRYALELKDPEIVEIFKLGSVKVTREEVRLLLTKSKDDTPNETNNEENMECTNAMLDSFLNGFIIFKRGKQEPKPGMPERPILAISSNETVNNILLKKLKIALALTSEDMLDLLKEAGVVISKGELSAVLEKKDIRIIKRAVIDTRGIS